MTSSVTNDDIMQALNEFSSNVDKRFDGVDDRLDGVESRLDRVESRLDRVENKQDEHTRILSEHSRQLSEHSASFASINITLEQILGEQEAHKNDIMAIYEILERIEAKIEVTQAELDATKEKLEHIIKWAQKVAKKLDIPLSV